MRPRAEWDSWRALAHVTGQGARIFTRRGRGHQLRFPAVNDARSELPVGTVLDGELVCLEPLPGGRVRCRFDRLSGSGSVPNARRSSGRYATR